MDSKFQDDSLLDEVLSPWLQRCLVLAVWVSAGLVTGSMLSMKQPLLGWSPAGQVSTSAQSRSSATRTLPQRPSRSSKPASEADLLRHRLAYQGISDLNRWGIANERASKDTQSQEGDWHTKHQTQGCCGISEKGHKSRQPAQQIGIKRPGQRAPKDHLQRGAA